jgi:isoleucyl-tRNA synthetase
VDGQGKKMSKSLGNTVAPQDVSSKMGAEIIRLWVASTDYSGDLGIDDKILARVVDAYRRIRNTLRFLLANTSDFDAEPTRGLRRDAGDRPVARAAQLQQEILATTRSTSSTPWSPSCSCSARKTWAASTWTCSRTASTPRPQEPGTPLGPDRAHQITQALLRWMAPFLSFTAEEAWKIVGHSESIFLEKFTELPAGDEGLLAKWTRLREIRNLVNKDIEVVRTTGAVGSSLQAEVTLTAEPEDLALLQSLKDDLKFVFITSAATAVAGDALTTTVKASEHAKCERCWHYREDVGVNPEHPRSAAAATAICTARAKSAPRLEP